MDLSWRLFRVGKTSAPQLGCIFHGESISGRFTSVWALYRSISRGQSQMRCGGVLRLQSRENVIFHAFGVPPAVGLQGVLIFSPGYYLESSMTLTHRNRCIECPDASKTIKNQLPVKKYIEAMVRKSFQLELVTEIGPFENNWTLTNFVHYIDEKDSLKKIKTILTVFPPNLQKTMGIV